MVVRRCVLGPLTWFVFAIAAAAAACGDLIVEMLAERGTFGAGRFSDGSNADVMPVAALGLLLLARFSYVRVREQLGRDGAIAAFPALEPQHGARLLPPIFAVQIALLWVMETSEQYVVFGHGFAPLVWLGGPVAIGLATHALVAIAMLAIARALLGACEPRVVRLLRFLRAQVALGAGAMRAVLLGRQVSFNAPRTFVASIFHERAPPPPLRHA